MNVLKVFYDTDTRCIIDNREGAAGGKATVGSKTPKLRTNADGSIYIFLGPDAPPKGWEANYVRRFLNVAGSRICEPMVPKRSSSMANTNIRLLIRSRVFLNIPSE